MIDVTLACVDANSKQFFFNVFSRVQVVFFMVPGPLSWFFKVPRWFFHGSSQGFMVFQGSTLVFNRYWSFLWFFKVLGWFFMVPGGFSWFFQGSRFVFHGSKWVFMVFQGFRLVFRGSRWVLRVNHGSMLVFIVTGQFL